MGGFGLPVSMSKSTLETLTEDYDQQALEPCEACGWKTLIPDEGCLNCRMTKLDVDGHRRKLLSAIGLLKARAFDLGRTQARVRLYETAIKDLEDLYFILFENGE